MRRVLYIFFFIIGISYAQNKQLLYDFAGLPQTLMTNPGAVVDNKFYVGMPLFSQVSVQGGFTGFSVYDIFSVDGVNINSKIKDAVNGFGKSEFTQISQQLEVISAGFKLNESTYLSVGFYQEFEFLAKIPKDVVDLFYTGNTELNRSYSVRGASVRAEMVGVLHAGISKKINKKWQIGGRFKLYSSVFNAKSKLNKGSFFTTNGDNNIYAQTLSNVDLLLQTSGLDFEEGEEVKPSYFTKGLLFGGSIGMGVDIGFTHFLDKQWAISGSMQDIGFVYNTKDVVSYKANGNFETEGFHLIFDENSVPSDYWSDLKDEFDNATALDTINTNYVSFRPLKINAAINYSFGKKFDNCRFDLKPGFFVNKVGGQLFSTVGAVHSYISATLFYERWFNKFIQAKVTYTADPYSFSNIGLGVSTHLGAFNLYVLADNLLYLNNLYAAKSAGVQVGVNIIFYNK